jgi:RES domain
VTRRVPLPPAVLSKVSVYILTSAEIVHRTHASGYRSAEFNPCEGQPSRFAPFKDEDGNCVPTLYGATSREAAAFETIFHDIEASAKFKTVRLDVVEARTVSQIKPKRDLRLFEPDLMAWGLTRGQLIDTPKSAYGETVLWAQRIHESCPDIDGLMWTSRRCDPERCVVVFGDRVSEEDFEVEDAKEVSNDSALLLELRAYGKRAGIYLVS